MSRSPVFYVRATMCAMIWYGFTFKGDDPLFPNKDFRDRPHMYGTHSRHNLLRIMQLRESIAAALIHHSAFCEPPEGDDNMDNRSIIESHFPGARNAGEQRFPTRDFYIVTNNGILRQEWFVDLENSLDKFHDVMLRCRQDLSLKLAGSPNGRDIKHNCDMSYKFHPAKERYTLDYRHPERLAGTIR